MIKKKMGRPAKAAVKPTYKQSESLQVLALETLLDDAKFNIESLEHQAIGYRAVINYLEHKLP